MVQPNLKIITKLTMLLAIVIMAPDNDGRHLSRVSNDNECR